jgi:hypothetical protein
LNLPSSAACGYEWITWCSIKVRSTALADLAATDTWESFSVQIQWHFMDAATSSRPDSWRGVSVPGVGGRPPIHMRLLFPESSSWLVVAMAVPAELIVPLALRRDS